MGDDFDYPADDSDFTWHMHDDGGWGMGINCEECRGVPTGRDRASTLPYFNITRLKQQNVDGVTVNEQIQETYKGARELGIDITRA